MRKVILLIFAVLLVLFLLSSSLFTVDRTEFVYLTQFGRPVATFDGADPQEAGLHFKWPAPIQSVQRLDRRLQSFTLPETELLTHDPRGRTIDKTLTVDAYVCWRIADKEGVDRFIRTVGTPDQARTTLAGSITSRLGAAISQMQLDDLISVDPDRVERQRAELRQRLLNGTPATTEPGLQEEARGRYGIEVVDIRLRRTNHPPAVQEAIFERIRSERDKKVAEYQSQGAQQAEDIKSDAERKVRELLAQARAEEQRIKGDADAEADRIRNQAHAKDAEFYTFLKKLEEYQRILGDNKTMLLLSTHRELFDLLFKPPAVNGGSSGSPPIAGSAPPGKPVITPAPNSGGGN